MVLYVDDFLIWNRSKEKNNVERQSQLCLNKIEKNGSDLRIKIVGETKFWGIILDSKLSFTRHIKRFKAKSTKALDMTNPA